VGDGLDEASGAVAEMIGTPTEDAPTEDAPMDEVPMEDAPMEEISRGIDLSLARAKARRI
jgi:hypothetical protein